MKEIKTHRGSFEHEGQLYYVEGWWISQTDAEGISTHRLRGQIQRPTHQIPKVSPWVDFAEFRCRMGLYPNGECYSISDIEWSELHHLSELVEEASNG